MKLLTIPPPAHALVVTVTRPKNIYFSELMVGASPAALITNSAPLAPYDICPFTIDQSEPAPCVKSVVRVVPNAGSGGHEAIDGKLYLTRW
jgi:hypothetical protein